MWKKNNGIGLFKTVLTKYLSVLLFYYTNFQSYTAFAKMLMAYSISLPASVLSVTLNVRYDSSAKRRRSCYNLFPKCNPFISVHFEFVSFFFVNQELVVNNSILGFYMVSPCIATLRRWCSKEMYCHDCEEIFSKKGKNDNAFQII